MPALIVRDGPGAGERLEVEAEVVLGRESQGSLQHDGEVSRRHAAVRPAAAGLEIEDLGSSNGTFVNDERIAGATPLGAGDVIRVGQTTLEVEATAATAGTVIRDVPEAAPPQAVPPADATAPLDVGPGPVPAGPPPGPPSVGPPPAGPPPVAAPPYAPPLGAPPGPRSGTGAAVALFILAGVGVLWGGFDAFRYFSDLDVVDIFGLDDTFMILIGCMALVIVGALLAIPAGVMIPRGRGRGLGVTAGVLAVLGAAATLVIWLSELNAGADIVTWAGMIGTLVLGILALILAASARPAPQRF